MDFKVVEEMKSTERATLDAFSRALAREAHVLTRQPDLLWQQLYNRLQWAEEPVTKVVNPEFQRRSAIGATPWFRTCKRHPESEAFSRTLAGHQGGVACCVFTPDGYWLVSGGEDGTLRVWNPARGTQIAVLNGHEGRVTDCVLVAGGAIVATVGVDGTLRAWSIAEQRGLGILLKVNGPLLACAAGSNRKEVYAGGFDGKLHAVPVPQSDEPAGAGAHRLSTEPGIGISTLDVSPDGTTVACGHADGSVSLWDPASFYPHRTAVLGAHTDMVFSACFTPDGRTLITGDGAGIIRFWDCVAHSLITEVRAHSGVVNGCIVSPNGDRCISVGDDTKIRIAFLGSDRPPTFLKGHYRPTTCCAVSPTGAFLASGSDDGIIRLWELDTANVGLAKVDAGHDRWAVASSFSADGSRLVSGSRDGDMIVWDALAKETVTVLGPQPGLEYCDLSPDGEHVVSCGDGATLWSIASGGKEANLHWNPPVRWCKFSPDGEVVAGFDSQGKQMWDLTEPDPPFVTRTDRKPPVGNRKQKVNGSDLHFVACRGAFSPLGSRVATPGPNGAVLLWEVDSDDFLVLGRHDGEVSACAWDPGGRFVASAGEDRIIRLWKVSDRTPLGTLEGHDGWVNHVEFLNRGLLVSASSDGTIRLWDTEARAMLCRYLAIGNIFLSCAVHLGRRLLCTTDIAGDVTWLTLECVQAR